MSLPVDFCHYFQQLFVDCASGYIKNGLFCVRNVVPTPLVQADGFENRTPVIDVVRVLPEQKMPEDPSSGTIVVSPPLLFNSNYIAHTQCCEKVLRLYL